MKQSFFETVQTFYDNRVFSPDDLNARMATLAGRAAHHHAGVLWQEDPVPEDDEEALAWLYKSEEALSDFVWAVISTLAPQRPRRMLDLGCGEGGTAVRFYELGGNVEVTGITVSPKQQQAAQKNCPPGRFIVGNMLEADFSQDQFDVAYAIESTEYLGPVGLGRLMSRVGRWLAPGGLLVIVAGSRSEKTTQDAECVWAFDSHYKTALSSTRDYVLAAAANELSVAAKVDLAQATLPYWIARRDDPRLRNSEAGAIEALVTQVLQDGRGEYNLMAWYKNSRSI